ncbi:MAG: SPOR domain-containing protein [Candidatus Neomarinimicrobiota bacterium]
MIPWKTWSKLRLAALFPFLMLALAWGQDLDAYFELAYQGQRARVAEALPELYQQHPNDGSVLFLEGLITEDGDAAVDLFKRVTSLYPTGPHAPDALLKVGEYYYSRGLYVQAAQYLKRIPVHYPRSDLVYQGIRLYLNALLVSGARDTARFYAQVFSRKYPEVEFDLEAGRAAGLPPEKAAAPGTVVMAPAPAEPAAKPAAPAQRVKGIRLQVGAFSVRENAERQQALLESLNYKVAIERRVQNERALHLVMVEGFRSRDDARLAGELLKDNYGIDFLVVSED